MNIRFSADAPLAVPADVLAFGVGKDLAGFDALEAAFGASLRDYATQSGFTGSAGSAMNIPALGNAAAGTVVLVGTGDGSTGDRRLAAGKAGREARTLGAESLAVALNAGGDEALMIEACLAGNYTFDKYKPEKDRKPAAGELVFVGDGAGVDRDATLIRADWQAKARDLVNEPAAAIYPASLAAWAVDNLGALDHVEVEVWGMDKLEAEGCVGIIAVGQGSAQTPRLIKASYRPPGATQHVALVGKGVTFDAGGLSLKPSSGMQTMRCDMGGSATVLGAFGAIAAMGKNIAVDVWVGAAENMLGGNAFKLGDVLTYKNGVTVEIHNTDAEGRLVLADCLIRACEVEGVTHLVDAATLTGACVVAVGDDYTGLFTDSDEFAADLHAAATAASEGLWRLPLHKPYNRLLKGEWGQIKNVGGRAAGATTAALYLQHFVDGPTWAHLDIAGSSFHDKGDGRYAAGATGEPVRTLINWMSGL